MKFIRSASLAGISLVAMSALAHAQTYQQSPTLDAAVADNSLPAVAERLGAEPRVLSLGEVGQYGGTWRSGMVGGNDRNMLFTHYGYEPLLAWDAEWSGDVVPNIAKAYSASEDSRSFTFQLREGMKWSDGSPFTADDVAFFIQDILPDDTLFPTKPSWLTVGGELPTIAVTSPTEFTISWSQPNGLFILNTASVYGVQLALLSKSYCSQFMPAYNADADKLAAEAGVASWAENLVAKCGVGIENIERWRNPDRPTLEPWKIVNPYVAGATRVTFERNPYYWKVDSAGNQLPYIDDISVSVSAEAQTLLLSVLAGEIDYEGRHVTNTVNLPVLAEGADAGGFHIGPRSSPVGSSITISFNLNSQDATKAPVLAEKDFRIAMSHAIDRQAIIDAIFLGQGVPQQVSPRKDTPFYNERLATQYLEYNVEEANRMLDALGLDKRGGDGFRLAADGSPLIINVAAVAALGVHADVAELLTQYWQAVGVDARFSSMDRTRFYEEKTASQHDVVLWGATSGGVDVYIDPRDYFPFSTESNYAVNWAKAYLGDGGEEPPDYVKEQWALYDQIKATSNPEAQIELFQRILEITADQFYQIGISTAVPPFAVVSNKMANVAEHTPTGWIHPDPGTLNPEQFFYKN